MTYLIRPLIFQDNQQIEIEIDEYELYLDAKTCLLEAILLEEKMQYVLLNYRDYESQILSSALSDMIGKRKGYDEFQNERGESNRRLVSFLGSARAYLDHSGHHIKKILNAIEVPSFFISAKSYQYDNSFAYRMMEALRNYTHHRGLAIHSISFNRSWVGDTEGEKNLEFAVSHKIFVAELLKDKKFKREVASELKQKKGQLALTPLVREYVQSLSSIHETVRREMEGKVSEACGTISSALDRVSAEFGASVLGHGIEIVSLPDAGSKAATERSSLIPEFEQRYQTLKEANRPLKNVSKHYVTGKVEE